MALLITLDLQVWSLPCTSSRVQEGIPGSQGTASINRIHTVNDDVWNDEFDFFCFHLVQGIVRLGAVDADQHKSLGAKYGVQGFPTIKVFGTNKNSPSDYRGK